MFFTWVVNYYIKSNYEQVVIVVLEVLLYENVCYKYVAYYQHLLKGVSNIIKLNI